VALVDVQDDNQLWGDTYRGKLGSILDLQDQIARRVAAKLQLRLTGDEEKRLTQRDTENSQAYLLYREGAHHMNKFTEEGLITAIEYYERALKKDSNYALACVGLGRCYILLGALHQGPRKTFADAKDYMAKALKIDPASRSPHTGLGTIYLFHDWNWAAAERELKQAGGDLDPEQPTRNMYGFYLAAQGRAAEALAVMREVEEFGSLPAPRRNELAMAYNWTRQYDQAIVEAKKALEMDPNFPLAYAELGTAYVQKGRNEEAIAELRKALDRGQRHPRIRGLLGYAYAMSGKTKEARSLLEELKGQPEHRFGCALGIARIHAALGEKDQAFEWLRKACDERDSGVIWLKVDPTLDNLRADPRFTQILKDMGLPP
jgi:Tfp pilus assembly protein PilF